MRGVRAKTGIQLEVRQQDGARNHERQMEAEEKKTKWQAGRQEPREPRERRAGVTTWMGTGQATHGWIRETRQHGVISERGMDCLLAKNPSPSRCTWPGRRREMVKQSTQPGSNS